MLSKSDTSSCTRCSVPFALPFNSASADAFSGARHAATTRLVGTASSWRTISRPMPRFALRAGWLAREEPGERESVPGHEPGSRGHGVLDARLVPGEREWEVGRCEDVGATKTYFIDVLWEWLLLLLSAGRDV